eukprot:750631-Pyramimonas_sp.AAC.1
MWAPVRYDEELDESAAGQRDWHPSPANWLRLPPDPGRCHAWNLAESHVDIESLLGERAHHGV